MLTSPFSSSRLFLVVPLLLFLFPFPSEAQSANLISNPDFETQNASGLPEGFIRGRWGENSTTFSYPAEGVGGSRGAEITMSSRTSGDAKWAFAHAAVVPGREYRFADYYRSNVTTHITLEYRHTNGSFSYVDIAHPTPSASFKEVATRFRAPEGVESVTIFHLINTPGTLTVDRYSLTEAPPPHPANLIQNPSFEIMDGNGLPENWTRGRWGVNTARFVYPVPGQVGANAARVEMSSRTSGDAKWAHKEIPVRAGESYVFSDYFRSNTMSYVTVEFRHANGARTYRDISTLHPPWPNTEWRSFISQPFTVPEGAIGMTVYHLIKSIGHLEIDSYSVNRTTNTNLFPRGLVSIHFDDGWRSSYDVALPILDRAGFKSTHLITTDYLKPTFPGYIKPAEVRDIQARGHEVGAHTRSHPDLTALSAEAARAEIAGSRQDLISLGISPVSFFSYPFGAYNASVQQLVREAGFRGARSSDGGYNFRTTDKFALRRVPMVNTTTFEEVKGYIDTAIANKTWVILLFHQVNTSGEAYSVTPALFQQIVDYLKQKGVEPSTMQEVFSLM